MVVLEWIWMMGIIAVAIGAAVGMEWYQRRCRRRKREWQIEDKAIRFGEAVSYTHLAKKCADFDNYWYKRK